MSLSWAVLVLAIVGQARGVSEEIIRATLANLPEDTLRNFTQLAAAYGRPAAVHRLTTPQKYIITVFNIPGNKSRPVLMLHGVFDTADGFMLKENKSLALRLAAEGYDVWLMNCRGNRYSRAHETLDPDKDTQYWQYDLHDMATDDLATTVDYVLNMTGQKRLSLVGFSQGTTLPLILVSWRPTYADKVKVFAALAPVVYLTNARPMLSFIIQISRFLDWLLPPSFVELAGYHSLTKAVMNLACTQTVIGYELCYYGGFNSLSGDDAIGITRQSFPTIMGHFPAGASRMSLMHFAQIGQRKTFARFDHGADNFKKYFSFTPPEYDLSKVTMPVLLVSGRADTVSTLEDVATLKARLPKAEHMVVRREEFNHLDHLWAFDAYDEVYVHVIDTLNKYNE